MSASPTPKGRAPANSDRRGEAFDIDAEMSMGRTNIRFKPLCRKTIAWCNKPQDATILAHLERTFQHTLRENDGDHNVPAGRIDRSRSHLNVVLAGPGKVADVMRLTLDTLDGIGAKLPTKTSGVIAIEAVIFSGRLDPIEFFPMALQHVRRDWPGCLIVLAVVHNDEAAPHMHITLLPLLNGQLQAGVLQRGDGKFSRRQARFVAWASTRMGPIALEGHGLREDRTLGSFAAKSGAQAGQSSPMGHHENHVPWDNAVSPPPSHSDVPWESCPLNVGQQPDEASPDNFTAFTTDLEAIRKELAEAVEALSIARAEIRTLRSDQRIEAQVLRKTQVRLAAEVTARNAAEHAMLDALDGTATSASLTEPTMGHLTEAEIRKRRCEIAGRRSANELLPHLPENGFVSVSTLASQRIPTWTRDDKLRAALEALVEAGMAEFRDLHLKAGHGREYRRKTILTAEDVIPLTNPHRDAEDATLSAQLPKDSWVSVAALLKQRIRGWTSGPKLRGALERLVKAGKAECREHSVDGTRMTLEFRGRVASHSGAPTAPAPDNKKEPTPEALKTDPENAPEAAWNIPTAAMGLRLAWSAPTPLNSWSARALPSPSTKA